MKAPLAGQMVKLAHPVSIEIAPMDQGFLPLELTSEHILIFMGEKEGRWHVLSQGLPVPSATVTGAFQNAQFSIPKEHFEEATP